MTGAPALVEAALQSLEGRRGHRDDEIRAIPAIRAIIDAPGDVRRQCILIAARDEQWPGLDLLRLIARKQAGLTLDDIEELLAPPARPRYPGHAWEDARKLASLASQIEATWKVLDEAGRARLLPQLERAAATYADYPVTDRLRKLIVSAGSEDVPCSLVGDTSEAGRALRAVLAAAQEPDPARARLIRLLAGYPASGRPGNTWRKEAALVGDALDRPRDMIAALLDAALDAPDYEHEDQNTDYRYPRYVTGPDEAFLCGLTVVAGQVATGDADLLPRLRRLALKAITGIGSYASPRSVRLANHCVEAIAAAALPSSVTELLKIERGTRHGSLLRQVRKSVDALAAAQGLTRDELLEMAVEEHGLSPEGTRRTALPEAWLAVIEADARTARLSYLDPGGRARKSLPPSVRQAGATALAAAGQDVKAIRTTIGNERARLDACLSAGRSWPLSRWRALYLDHPVTGRLSRALIWSVSNPAGTVVATGLPVSAETLLTSDGSEIPMPADRKSVV